MLSMTAIPSLVSQLHFFLRRNWPWRECSSRISMVSARCNL